MTTRDAGAAAGMLRTRLERPPEDEAADAAPRAWHRGEKAAHDALEGAKRRPIGNGGWGFDRRTSDADITPIVSMGQALWGLVSGAVPEVSVYSFNAVEDAEPAEPERSRVDAAAAHLGIFNLEDDGEPDGVLRRPSSLSEAGQSGGENSRTDGGEWEVTAWVG